MNEIKLSSVILETDIEKQKELYRKWKASLVGIKNTSLGLQKSKVKSVRKICKSEDEYVYDIGMRNENHPWFFGNNILVHNSCYFSVYPTLKDEIAKGDIIWTKDSVIDVYNDLAKAVSDTFPKFLLDKLNVPTKRTTGVIASSRETVSESALFIVKKRYACLMYDKDGIRLDVDGKPGKVKAMGLDLKRADTPKFVQKFLSEILLDTLTDKGETVVVDKIRLFKEKFENMKPWQQGTPRAVNKLSFYRDKEELHMHQKLKGEAIGQLTMPGHVRASLAWNHLRELNHDRHSMKIIDGQKIVVCKLKESSENRLTSIAFPTDCVHLPQWFLDLPFDSDEMMIGIVDKKIKNLIGCLSWDLTKANKEHEQFASLFDLSGM